MFTTSVFSRGQARRCETTSNSSEAIRDYNILWCRSMPPLPPSPAKGEVAQCTEVFYWLELQVVVLLRQKLVQRHISVDGVNLDSFWCLAKKNCALKEKEEMEVWFTFTKKMVKWQGGNAETDLKADSVFWICLLTFRRSEHWRYHRINTGTGRRGEAKKLKKAKKDIT